MAELSLRKIEKTYPNGFKAVHGVDLDIRDGEFMVFVGPSGCAKSTLLRMVAGLERITAGELLIGGRRVNDLPPKQRGIAMVFQNYALYPHMRVYDNLAFGLKLSGLAKTEVDARVRHAARLLEMEQLLDRFPKQLSGGQAQRVAVGRAIVKKPEVFLFDEPLSNLDAKLRASMRVRLTELHQTLRDQGQAATVIYVTHDQVEAMTMGERICVLKEGVIQQVDTPTALYDRPANTFVASFIGSPEMNIRRARVEANVQGSLGLRLLVGEVASESDAASIEPSPWLPLPASKAQHPELPPPGTELQLGLRPEHLQLKPREDGGSLAVQARFRALEHMGNEAFVHVMLGTVPLVARVPADDAAVLQASLRDAVLSLYLNMGACHLFDAKSGLRLC